MHIHSFRDLRDIQRSDISELIWKWRCKIFGTKEEPNVSKQFDHDLAEKGEGETPASGGRDPTQGSDVVIKTLYEGKNSNPNEYDWVDYPPKQLSKSAARIQERAALKVYKVKDRSKPAISGRYPLMFHKLEVQNPLLVAALEPILRKENCRLDINETAKFKHPFSPLWFCQEDIAALHKRTEAANPLKPYLQLLVGIMDEMFAELRRKRSHLNASNLVDFSTAWTLFPRGATIYSYELNSEFLCKVHDTSYKHHKNGVSLILSTKVVVFNGERFVWRSKVLDIDGFEGNVPIQDLQHYPLQFHAKADAIKERLISRGKKALDLQDLAYLCYDGIAIHPTKDHTEKHNVQGRILVDCCGYNKYKLVKGKRENKDPDFRIDQLEAMLSAENDDRADPRDINSSDDSDTSDSETEGEGNVRQGGRRLSKKQQIENKKEMLAREQDIAFISGMVGGYALKNRLWVQFYIEDIKPMVWNDKAFSHLVYDEQQKDLVLSFVENHAPFRRRRSSVTTTVANTPASRGLKPDDVIHGKGQGLIILLSGPPGTGKTLTAEAVADRTRRPLFYLQAEDLGIDASSLGANIKRVFEMATEWNAVILLDEADVFMATRNPNDIHRNELVSIFLRELEYFRGILFLTTNLYDTIDTAFRSRVSLHLIFKALSRDAREAVWRKFLARGVDARLAIEASKSKGAVTDNEAEARPTASDKPLDDEDIRELSLWQLNGREIQNAVRMVYNWCHHKGYMVTLERLESGIRVTSPHTSKDSDIDESLYD